MQLTLDGLSTTSSTSTPSVVVAFRSGMSRAKDFRGAAEAGVPIGVVAGELTLGTVLFSIPRYIRNGGFVFVDSGAFSEIKTGIVPDFNRVLRTYETLAEDADFDLSHLYVVSPDKVGDQLVTLERIAQYKDRINALIKAGCKLIVPIQRGSMPAAEMLDRVVQTLGTNEFVAGIPSNQEAMSIEECSTLNHHSYHILGRVQMNPDQVSRLRALRMNNPQAEITADANWLRSRIDKICQITEAERRARRYTPWQEEVRLLSTRSSAVKQAIQNDTVWFRS
jgi:hypothetical protein